MQCDPQLQINATLLDRVHSSPHNTWVLGSHLKKRKKKKKSKKGCVLLVSVVMQLCIDLVPLGHDMEAIEDKQLFPIKKLLTLHKQFINHRNHSFSQNNILLRETGLEGGVTAKTDRHEQWKSSAVQSVSRSGSDQIVEWCWYQPVHPLLSPSAQRAASAASSWMSTLREETKRVRQKRSCTVQD